jgi:hypothetical protein
MSDSMTIERKLRKTGDYEAADEIIRLQAHVAELKGTLRVIRDREFALMARLAELEAEKSKQLPAHWQAELDESKTLRARMDDLEKSIKRFMENNDE